MLCELFEDWAWTTVEPEEADVVLAALGLLHNRMKCVILEEYGGDYLPEVSSYCALWH